MRGILSRYFITSFIKSFFAVFLCFFVIVAILESMEVVRKYFSAGYDPSILQIVKITFCRSVVSISSFFSFIVLLSAIVFFTQMHNKMELTIVKGAGISPFRILKSLCIAVSILGVFYISVFDGLTVYSYKNYRTTNTNLKRGPEFEANMTVTNKGIWLRDTFNNRSYIISARGFSQRSLSLYNTRIFEFGKDNDFIRSIRAKNISISNGNWNATDCIIVTAGGYEMTENQLNLPTKLSFSNLTKMIADPRGISFWSLSKYASMFEKVGLSGIGYKVHWYSRLSAIFQMFAFLIIATAFCINQNSRNRKAYIAKVTLLMSLAFPVHFINNVVMAYGEEGSLPLPIASFIVPALIFTIGILLLKKK